MRHLTKLVNMKSTSSVAVGPPIIYLFCKVWPNVSLLVTNLSCDLLIFSKALDLINHHILFYKIMKGGWYGPVIDTLKNCTINSCFV